MKPCSRMSERASTGLSRHKCATSGAVGCIFAQPTRIGGTRSTDHMPRSPAVAGTLPIPSLSCISIVTCASLAPTWRESSAVGRMVPNSLSLDKRPYSFRHPYSRLITSTSSRTTVAWRRACPSNIRTSPAAVSLRGNDVSLSALRRGLQATRESPAGVQRQLLRRAAKSLRGLRVRRHPR